MFYFQENFLSKKQSEDIIKIYHANVDKTHEYNGNKTFPLPLSLLSENIIDNISVQITNICQFLTSIDLKIDNAQIVRWPVGSFHQFHYDAPADVCSAIIYLNDNFIGGRTCFEFINVKPEKGKLVVFSNSKYLHGIEPVEQNDRYTLIYWFTKNM